MSTHFVRFFSQALAGNGEFYMCLPEKGMTLFLKDNPHYQRKTKTLILLHGYNGGSSDWLYGSQMQDYSMKYNLAVVTPAGRNSFYLNKISTGYQFQTLNGEELIRFLRDTYRLTMTKEDTFIGGFSMGGFGALHTGFAYPETFGGVMALSSALIIHQLKDMSPKMQSPMANYEYYVDTFGDLSKAEKSDHNPEVLFKRNKRKGIANPRIYMACGTEDFLITPNREMRDFLKKQKADLKYEEGPGMHNWDFWTPYTYKGIEYLLEEK